MPMLTSEEVTRVIKRWQNTDDNDFERMLADYVPQDTWDNIANMVRNSDASIMLPGLETRITGAFMAGLELGWWFAAACEAKDMP